jgi:trk system potassium uptake protein TrkH
MGNFADLSVLSKAVLSLCMLIGRLEIYPIMLLMFPSFWKRGSI